VATYARNFIFTRSLSRFLNILPSLGSLRIKWFFFQIIYELLSNNCTNECLSEEYSISESLGQVDPIPLQVMMKKFNISVSK